MTRILAAVLTLACVSTCEPAAAALRHKHRASPVPVTVEGVGTIWVYGRPPRRR